MLLMARTGERPKPSASDGPSPGNTAFQPCYLSTTSPPALLCGTTRETRKPDGKTNEAEEHDGKSGERPSPAPEQEGRSR